MNDLLIENQTFRAELQIHQKKLYESQSLATASKLRSDDHEQQSVKLRQMLVSLQDQVTQQGEAFAEADAGLIQRDVYIATLKTEITRFQKCNGKIVIRTRS